MGLARNDFDNKYPSWKFVTSFFWNAKLELTGDIYSVIIPFFTVKELKKNSRVNKKWNELCQLSLNLYKEENYFLISKYIVITKTMYGIRFERDDISNEEIINSYPKFEMAKLFKDKKDALQEVQRKIIWHDPNFPREGMPRQWIKFAIFKVSLFSQKEYKELIDEKDRLHLINDNIVPMNVTFDNSSVFKIPSTNPTLVEIDFKNYTKNYNNLFWNHAKNIVSGISSLLIPKLKR